jgi:hypothetical protein
MEIGDGALTGYQKPPPDHWADTYQHDFQLIDGWLGGIGHDPILRACTGEAITSDESPPDFFTLVPGIV